jgi:hypothetical protein
MCREAERKPEDRTLHVIWPFGSIIETEFMKSVLLGNLTRPIVHHVLEGRDCYPLSSNIMLVLHVRSGLMQGGDGDHKVQRYIAAFKSLRLRGLGVYHMSDERGAYNRNFYKDADYVIRNYYFQNIWQEAGPEWWDAPGSQVQKPWTYDAIGVNGTVSANERATIFLAHVALVLFSRHVQSR